jgi:hypothetical protein
VRGRFRCKNLDGTLRQGRFECICPPGMIGDGLVYCDVFLYRTFFVVRTPGVTPDTFDGQAFLTELYETGVIPAWIPRDVVALSVAADVSTVT